MLLVNGTVANVVDGDVHEFSNTRTHDDILYSSRKGGSCVLSFGELFGISCHSGNLGPEVVESFVMLESISIETFTARGKMND